MADQAHQVRGLAKAFIETLGKLTQKERSSPVTARYAGEQKSADDNMNKVLDIYN